MPGKEPWIPPLRTGDRGKGGDRADGRAPVREEGGGHGPDKLHQTGGKVYERGTGRSGGRRLREDSPLCRSAELGSAVGWATWKAGMMLMFVSQFAGRDVCDSCSCARVGN